MAPKAGRTAEKHTFFSLSLQAAITVQSLQPTKLIFLLSTELVLSPASQSFVRPRLPAALGLEVSMAAELF